MSSKRQPAGGQRHGKSLLSTFQAHIEEMRSLVQCKICICPLYEPFTLACGHTYCYSCLTRWFGNGHGRAFNKTCPECRNNVKVQPSPNYVLRDLVHMFISRAELLPENETTAYHLKQKEEATKAIETDRNTNPESTLFKGIFAQSLRPIHDAEDGVDRCPRCTYELEDGLCAHCSWVGSDFSVDSEIASFTDESGLDLDDSSAEDMEDEDDEDNPIDHWAEGMQLATATANRVHNGNVRDAELRRHRRQNIQNGTHRTAAFDGFDLDGFNRVPLARRPHGGRAHPLGTYDNDVNMGSPGEDSDTRGLSAFHREAIRAGERGMQEDLWETESSAHSGPSASGSSRRETSHSSGRAEASTSSSNTQAPRSRTHDSFGFPWPPPAYIVINDSSPSEEEEEDDEEEEEEQEEEEDNHRQTRRHRHRTQSNQSSTNGGISETITIDSSSSSDSASPPRPAAARRALLHRHRGSRHQRDHAPERADNGTRHPRTNVPERSDNGSRSRNHRHGESRRRDGHRGGPRGEESRRR